MSIEQFMSSEKSLINPFIRLVSDHPTVERFVIAYKISFDNLRTLLELCEQHNKIVVYIVPTQNTYDPRLSTLIREYRTTLRVYELDQGTMVHILARARDYCRCKPNSLLVESV